MHNTPTETSEQNDGMQHWHHTACSASCMRCGCHWRLPSCHAMQKTIEIIYSGLEVSKGKCWKCGCARQTVDAVAILSCCFIGHDIQQRASLQGSPAQLGLHD